MDYADVRYDSGIENHCFADNYRMFMDIMCGKVLSRFMNAF